MAQPDRRTVIVVMRCVATHPGCARSQVVEARDQGHSLAVTVIAVLERPPGAPRRLLQTGGPRVVTSAETPTVRLVAWRDAPRRRCPGGATRRWTTNTSP